MKKGLLLILLSAFSLAAMAGNGEDYKKHTSAYNRTIRLSGMTICEVSVVRDHAKNATITIDFNLHPKIYHLKHHKAGLTIKLN